jgi:hypothetical protein
MCPARWRPLANLPNAACRPKKHLKRLNAPHHWMLDKLSGIFVSLLLEQEIAAQRAAGQPAGTAGAGSPTWGAVRGSRQHAGHCAWVAVRHAAGCNSMHPGPPGWHVGQGQLHGGRAAPGSPGPPEGS